MAKLFETITPEIQSWIDRQEMFFVATAPLDAEGHVNCSPKGGDSFRILGPNEIAYQDYTGSGAETIAHLRENGRIVIMFCAFSGGPKIVRLHGQGTLILESDAEYEIMAKRFPPHAGTRAFIRVNVHRISDSCGYAVPFYEFQGPRDVLDKWSDAKSDEEMRAFRRKHTTESIDGLPAFNEPS